VQNPQLTEFEESNKDAGYARIIPKSDSPAIWIPFLPGYTVFTKLAGICFRLHVSHSDQYLLFDYEDYGTDTTFTRKVKQGTERLAFYQMFNEYNINNTSISSILGFSEPFIIYELQSTVHAVVPKLFASLVPPIPQNNSPSTWTYPSNKPIISPFSSLDIIIDPNISVSTSSIVMIKLKKRTSN